MARVYRAHPVGGGESVGELLYLTCSWGKGGESHTHQGRQEHEEHGEHGDTGNTPMFSGGCGVHVGTGQEHAPPLSSLRLVVHGVLKPVVFHQGTL